MFKYDDKKKEKKKCINMMLIEKKEEKINYLVAIIRLPAFLFIPCKS